MAKEKIKWHPAFAAAIQLELKEYKEYLDFSIEHELTDEPLKIDVIVIKKLMDIEINKSIGKILKGYNIFEYKSPSDYLSIDDYYKVRAYAYLYKSLSGKTNSIPLEEITITLTSTKFPKKLVEYLKTNQGISVVQDQPGIYYFHGSDLVTQLLITKELSDEDSAYLKLLQFEHKNTDTLSRWIYEYISNNKNPLYAIIMDVLTESNPNEVLEVYKSMGVAKISDDNRAFLMEAVKKLEIDKMLKEEGIKEGIKEGIRAGENKKALEVAKNLLSLGVDVLTVIKATGLDKEEVEKLKNSMH